MKAGAKIYLAVTNDLSFDQRMIRICGTLSQQGFAVTLVGRRLPSSLPLQEKGFRQKRLRCVFNSGFLFYAEYNIRLLWFLLLRRMDLICAIDLDTILPCYFISRLKRIPRVYDAHELFCEMKEVATRPRVYRFWKGIERYCVPKFINGYTVNETIAKEFAAMYGSNYAVIRNLPVLRPLTVPEKPEKYILYQGAVNEGRSFETLIPAMKRVDARLIICGDGNFMKEARRLVIAGNLQDKVLFKGRIVPEKLWQYTVHAWIGVTLFENTGLNNYLSLGNRFFDYLQAGIPQVCVNYPEYQNLNGLRPFALLIDNPDEESIANALNTLLENAGLYNQLQQNCLQRRLELNWQEEEKKLIDIYKHI